MGGFVTAILYPGKHGQRKGLPLCKRVPRPRHHRRQPVGGGHHPGQGEDENPYSDRLRLHCQRSHQPEHLVSPGVDLLR